MTENPVASLDPRHRKLIENARIALERGHLDYVFDATAQVLKAAPGCLEVRKLQRVAQLQRARERGGGLIAKMTSGFSTAPFLVRAGKREPVKMLATAEAALAKNPENVAALRMLAEAARELGLKESVAFALEAVREIDPTDRANLFALGEAWLAAGKAAEALSIADEMLRLRPADAEAQALMRKASVAQTVAKGGWAQGDSYRSRLRNEAQVVSLEQAAKKATADAAAKPAHGLDGEPT